MPASPPKLSTEHELDGAEAMVVGWELASRKQLDFRLFCEQLVQDLSGLSGATVKLGLLDQQKWMCIASSDADCSTDSFNHLRLDELGDFTPVQIPLDREPETTDGCYVCQRLHVDVAIALSLAWTSSTAGRDGTSCDQDTVVQLARAANDLVSKVYLREQLAVLKGTVTAAPDREVLIAALYQGTELPSSLHQIARIVASQVNADRTSILRLCRNRARLIATSSNPNVDRRSRLVHLIEELAVASSQNDIRIDFVVGDESSTIKRLPESLERYLVESGCRRIHTVVVKDVATVASPIALIVSEWFSVVEPVDDKWLEIHVPAAIRGAIERDSHALPLLLGQIVATARSRIAAVISVSLVVISLLLALVPVPFTLPVNGHVKPVVHRRLFAPANAMVTDIAVRNGQSIKRGDELFVLRSSMIDLQEEQVRGDLMTAKTQLASLHASKTNSRRLTNAEQQPFAISASEEALKVELEGLEKQLALIAEQKQELTIRSPIDGIFDRWDLEQSLSMRPVAQGQFLADLYSTTDSWIVELDIPDAQAAYLQSPQGTSEDVRFRLQSRADQHFQAKVIKLAESTTLDAKGNSVLQLTCLFSSGTTENFTIGATVWADVDCGNRALGFVIFRGLIEWLGRQSWY